MSNHRETMTKGREAEQAKLVLDRAFDRARDAMMTKLLATSPGEPQQVLTLHAAIQGIEAARQAVVQEIGAGKLSESALVAEQNKG